MTISEFFQALRDHGLRFREYSEAGVIRTPNEPYRLCPLCALAKAKYQLDYFNWEWYSAAQTLGLAEEDAARIARAADNATHPIRGYLMDFVDIPEGGTQ
jgi:hypothetical protein